jgi:hypothetical protein
LKARMVQQQPRELRTGVTSNPNDRRTGSGLYCVRLRHLADDPFQPRP